MRCCARSADVGAPLSVARPLHSYAGCALRSIELGLAGAHQHENAAVAVALCRKLAAHERSHGPASSEARAAAEEAALARGELPHAWRTGLESATRPGRAQIVPDSGYGGPEDGATMLPRVTTATAAAMRSTSTHRLRSPRRQT